MNPTRVVLIPMPGYAPLFCSDFLPDRRLDAAACVSLLRIQSGKFPSCQPDLQQRPIDRFEPSRFAFSPTDDVTMVDSSDRFFRFEIPPSTPNNCPLTDGSRVVNGGTPSTIAASQKEMSPELPAVPPTPPAPREATAPMAESVVPVANASAQIHGARSEPVQSITVTAERTQAALAEPCGRRQKRCQHPDGCRRQASYGPLGGCAAFCAAHRLPSHRNWRSRRCRAPGCEKQPVFGDPPHVMWVTSVTEMRVGDVTRSHPLPRY